MNFSKKFTCEIGTNLQYIIIAYRSLIKAYYELEKERYNVNSYNENKIRNKLVELAEKKPSLLPFRWVTELPDLSKNNRIDIELISPLSLEDKDLGIKIECKIIRSGSEYIDTKEAHTKTNGSTNGIMSFVSGKYASRMPIAGMIGFIKDGDISDKINKVDKKIKKHKKIKTIQNLTFYNIYSGFKYSYCSKHKRKIGLPKIDIYHLFFDFCYC